jgi:DMSO/TMAO reductase YedYZ molybdopterin-dependent catalytic subunit
MSRSWAAPVLLCLLAVLLVLAGCATPASPSPAGTAETSAVPLLTPTSRAVAPANPCDIGPIVVPTPADDPGYARLDPSTGLHVTGTMQLLDLATYRLRVTGKVDRPLELSYDEIRCLPKVQASPTLVCPGFFVDEATWAGAAMADVLALAGVQEGAQEVEFVSADGYSTTLSLDKALDRANFLAYEWEGEPLPRLHGFPLRVVIPDAQGNQWTKWLVEVRVR